MNNGKDTQAVFNVEVEFDRDEKRRHYILRLSDANLEYFLNGCPEVDRLIGVYNGDTCFNIMPGMSDNASREIAPKNIHGEYFINIGAPMPIILSHPTTEQVNKSAAERYHNLENAIRSFKKVPVMGQYDSKPFIIAYVSIELDR
ncbi:MAG: hypothetical protein ACP5NW_05215 [Candidatus Woesearchaeota archaeon]